MADMRDDLGKALLPQDGEKIDPIELARRDQKKSLPKRFYKHADIEHDGEIFALALDGRRARTPARPRPRPRTRTRTRARTHHAHAHPKGRFLLF